MKDDLEPRYPKRSKDGFVQVSVSIHERHLAALNKKQRRNKVTRRELVYAALQNYLEPEGTTSFEAQVTRRLRDLSDALESHRLRSEVLERRLMAFLKVWLCHHPEPSEDEKRSRERSLEARHERLFAIICADPV